MIVANFTSYKYVIFFRQNFSLGKKTPNYSKIYTIFSWSCLSWHTHVKVFKKIMGSTDICWETVCLVFRSYFLYPRPRSEGSYEFRSVRPSVYPSRRFLGICSLVFAEPQHGVRGPCFVACNRVRFSGKKIICPKNGENGPKIGFF